MSYTRNFRDEKHRETLNFSVNVASVVRVLLIRLSRYLHIHFHVSFRLHLREDNWRAGIMESMTSMLVSGVEFLYGCIFLSIALGYSSLQREFWFARTKEEELALQEGEWLLCRSCLILTPTFYSFS